MRARMSIRNIILIVAIVSMASMFFINMSFATNTGKITTETARLREKPETDSKVLELASLGDEVEILEEDNGWYKVKFKNIQGYIRTDLVEAKNNESKNSVKEENVQKSESTKTEETVKTSTSVTENVENTATAEETTAKEETIETNGKYNVSENLKLKLIPLIYSIESENINKDSEVEVLDIVNNWAKVKTNDNKEGWVITEKLVVKEEKTESVQEKTKAEEVKTEEKKEETKKDTTNTKTETKQETKTMYVNSQVVNIRAKADKTSSVVTKLNANAKVEVLSSENGWAYVNINGTKGYIAENLLSSSKQETSRSGLTERTTNKDTNSSQEQAQSTQTTEAKTTTSSGSSVVSYAQQFLGTKYVYGGTSTSGFDCSGFTQYVYKHFGVNLNRTAAAQYSNGTSVSELQAGDLVMFGKSGINHVGIYIGGNTFIHAANPSRGVTTDTLASGYYKTNYVGARRVF